MIPTHKAHLFNWFDVHNGRTWPQSLCLQCDRPIIEYGDGSAGIPRNLFARGTKRGIRARREGSTPT